MKKFEEEFDKNVTSVTLRQDGESVITVCDYNEAKAFGHGWVSPEDHQKVLESNKAYETSNLRMSEENAKFVAENIELTKEIAELKSQIEKQQPEIPEFVAKYIEKYKGTRTVYGILDKISRNQKVYPKLYEWVFKNEERQEIFAQAWLNGYTVAKEKRFYLKHKSVLIFDPDSDDSDVEELYLGAGGNFVPYKHLAKIFTQSQIDSMATESYEQIEVEG